MKIFLSAPDGEAARIVSAIVRKTGAEVIDTFSVEPGQVFERALLERITSADVYLGLLRAPADWQMYELGVAVALGRPIAVVAEPHFTLPPVVQADFHIQSPFSDERLIKSFVDVVVRGVQHGIVPQRAAATARVETARIQELLAEARRIRESTSGIALERLVNDVLSTTGLTFATNQEQQVADGRGREADALVHAPAVAPLLGSPLLVEIKRGVFSGARLDEIYRAIHTNLEVFGLRTALLLYLDPSSRRLPVRPSPRILAIDIEDSTVGDAERVVRESAGQPPEQSGSRRVGVPAYDSNILSAHIAACGGLKAKGAKGNALEVLCKYLFEQIPGVVFLEKNILDDRKAHELDLAFMNNCQALSSLGSPLILECKNHAKAVGSHHVAWFVTKLASRGAAAGVLVSLSGITGLNSTKSAVQEVLDSLGANRVRIIVLRQAEIEALATTEDLVTLLMHKFHELVLHRRVK